MKTRIRLLLPPVCTAIASLLIIVPAAQAGYVVTLNQVGATVVATGSGAIDLTGLTLLASGAGTGIGMSPVAAYIVTGLPQANNGLVDAYENTFPIQPGPTNFGSGSVTLADGGSGDVVGIDQIGGGAIQIFVPVGYVSGTALFDSSTYNSTNFTILGVTPGTYEWTWGTGANQNFTLKIGGAAVPDTGSAFGLLFVSVIALFGLNRLRRFQLA